jgi:hypothetical protein
VTAEADSPKDAIVSVPLTPGLQSAYSPQFVPSGDGAASCRIVFLSQDAACESGTHDGTVALHSLPWPEAVSFGQPFPQADAVRSASAPFVPHSMA